MISPEEYNSYYQQYIKLSQPDLTVGLENGQNKTVDFFRALPDTKHEHRYEEGKWTPKEVLLHIIDTERVFMYRALQISRADNVDLKGFDQDEFAGNSFANDRSMSSLIEEYKSVRASSLNFIKSCSPEVLVRMGRASESPLSVRAAAHIVCGHEQHHCTIIQERYL